MSHSDLASCLGFGLPQTYFQGGGLWTLFVIRRKTKHEKQDKKKIVLIRRRHQHATPNFIPFLCSLFCLTLVCGTFLVFSISLVQLLRAPSYKESSKTSQVESIYSVLSLTGMLARLCGCLGIVNVAVVGEFSPNTARASTESEMPGFHHAYGRGL